MSGIGHGGLEWLGRPDFQMQSPDQKKHKPNPQESPPSEYAPPLNPNSHHLTAGNPFDDNYNTASYRPPSSGNPYLRSPGYPGFGGIRMPPNQQSRMSHRFVNTYSHRNLPPQFLQNSMALGCHNSNVGPQENSVSGRQPMYNSGIRQNVCFPNQRFQHSHDENVNPQKIGQTFNPMREIVTLSNPHFNQQVESRHHCIPSELVTRSNPHFNPQVESRHHCIPSELAYNQPKASGEKCNSKEGTNKRTNRNSSPIIHIPEYILERSNAHFRNRSRLNGTNEGSIHSNNADYIIISPVEETPSQPVVVRGVVEGLTSENRMKTPLRPSRYAHSFSDSFYLCGICADEVSDDQDAIRCEVACRGWFHRNCTGMTEAAYRLLTAEPSAVWCCDTCMINGDVPLTRLRQAPGPTELNSDGR